MPLQRISRQRVAVLLDPSGPCARGREFHAVAAAVNGHGGRDRESGRYRIPHCRFREREVESWLISLAVRLLL
jgi:hypothetical protein